jgi:hypothetical protein
MDSILLRSYSAILSSISPFWRISSRLSIPSWMALRSSVAGLLMIHTVSSD